MDGMIELIVKRMRTDDLLVVLGDHGMTSSGDHGGDTTPEVTAGLLIHSPSLKFTPLTAVPRQIDLVPSLALLLGVPIPFSNLGIVIPQLFPKRQDLSQAVQLNYEQVIRDEPNSFSQLVIRSGVLLLQMGLYNGGSDSISVPPLLATLVILTLFHLGKMALCQALVSLAFLSVYFHWGLDLVSHDSDNIKLALLSTAWLVYAIAALVLVLNFRPNSEQSCAQQRWNIFHGLLPILYLLLGEEMAIGLTIFIMISLRIHSVVNAEFKTGAETTLLGLGFYFLGHSPTLTAIPWTAAFIGPCSCSPTFSPQPSYFAARCYYSLLSTSSR
ncbi:unnamed protein product, partial [Mesorhabditis spiculigera]